MKLLPDQNLSRRLLPVLNGNFPGSTHARLVGLEREDDETVWRWAKAHGHAIVTKDADSTDLAVVRDAPPTVIPLIAGNASDDALLAGLLRLAGDLRRFEAGSDALRVLQL